MCGTVWSGYGGVSVWYVWDSLERVWGNTCVLCVGQFGVDVGEKVYVVFGTVWNVFGRVIVCFV